MSTIQKLWIGFISVLCGYQMIINLFNGQYLRIVWIALIGLVLIGLKLPFPKK